ncbi:MAG TPA: hypothetical protein VNK24_08120 [Elusimicrobiota bacterium]|nr:hypothetical protein [Elusimicrobiota bacterium]
MSDGEQTAEAERFAVVAAESEAWNAAAAAKALASALKTPAVDQIARARRAWGVLAENLDRRAADDLSLSLAENGLPAVPVAQRLILPPPRALATKSLSWDDAELRTVAGGAALEPVAWADIAVLAAASLPQTVTRTIKIAPEMDLGKEALKLGLTLVTGIPMLGGGKKEETKVVRTSDITLVFDMVAPGLCLRVIADSFDYTSLGALKTYGAAANFKILFGEIAKRATAATLNRGARLLLDGKPLRDLGHESDEDLNREDRWLWALAERRRGAA